MWAILLHSEHKLVNKLQNDPSFQRINKKGSLQTAIEVTMLRLNYIIDHTEEYTEGSEMPNQMENIL